MCLFNNIGIILIQYFKLYCKALNILKYGIVMLFNNTMALQTFIKETWYEILEYHLV